MSTETLQADLSPQAKAAMKELRPAREIPKTFISSARSWWSAGEKESAAAEERLLRMLPFFQSTTWPRQNNDLPVVGTSSRVDLSSSSKHAKRYLNVFSITPTEPPASPKAPPAVLLHGFGAGLGFYFRNYPTLALWVARTGAPMHSLDWIGMGRSARVPFTVTAKRTDTVGRVSQAEAFFLDALEEWREREGLERVTLVGHSLGAYLAAAYAERYPERVAKLVLLSPAGVLGNPDTEQPSRELTDDRASISEGAADARAPEPATKGQVEAVHEQQKEEKEREPFRLRLLTYLWEEGYSPFQLLRNLTVFGPRLVGRYSSRRFNGLTEEETRNINDYILNITLAKGSGEYCISHILAPFAHARRPLVDRVSALKMPVRFVYGDTDWMDPEGGAQSVERMRAAGNSDAKVYIVPKSGHHVYLDNPDYINKLLMQELSFE